MVAGSAAGAATTVMRFTERKEDEQRDVTYFHADLMVGGSKFTKKLDEKNNARYVTGENVGRIRPQFEGKQQSLEVTTSMASP